MDRFPDIEILGDRLGTSLRIRFLLRWLIYKVVVMHLLAICTSDMSTICPCLYLFFALLLYILNMTLCVF